MDFKNKRFMTKGVAISVHPLLQILMWQIIDEMPQPKDYLQIFELTNENGQQRIIHTQEEPEYRREYLLKTDTPMFIGKIFTIDDETHSTMLLAEEY